MKLSIAVTVIAIVGAWVGVTSASAAQQEEKPVPEYFTDVPNGWRFEALPFPLEFAPSLAYTGVEELMFAPGMFDPEKADFFSYAFLWVVEGSDMPDMPKLKQDIEHYYYGLQRAVYADAEGPVAVQLHLVSGDSGSAPRYKGTIDWVEPFKTKAGQRLEFDAEFWRCSTDLHWGAYFIVAPDGADASVIKSLQRLSFKRCN